MEHLLEGLEARGHLFYPCCGTDLETPIERFSSGVSDFWFVDVYEHPLRQALALEYEVTHRRAVKGITLRRHRPYEIDVRTMQRPGNGEPRLHICRGAGYDAFRSLFKEPKVPITVFFYRGDSGGESGSNFLWLGPSILPHVLAQIGPGGLVVTDGSNSGGAGVPLAQPGGDRLNIMGYQLALQGILADRSDRTRIWQVDRPTALPGESGQK